MHELSICQGLMQQVETIAVRENAVRIVKIELQIGPLAGVEESLLKDAFPIAAAGSVAENATLIIESMPIRVKCSQCGEESEASINNLVCKACGDFRTNLIQGDELLLKSLELDRPDSAE